MGGIRAIIVWMAVALCSVCAVVADPLPREDLAAFVQPPFSIGEAVNDRGVWELLNSGGALAGYVFETEPMAPLPGFSGAPINVFVMLDLEGQYIDVRLISHNEPIFVSGLGEAPFHKYFEQYRGLSISQSLVVGTPYGDGGEGGALVYLDGVTKATASVRIAHESLLAATRTIAREKLQGVSSGPPAYPKRDYFEDLTWADLVAQGLATRKQITNAEVDAQFAGTIWADDDPQAQDDPDGLFLDLWVVDIGPPSIAKVALSPDSYAELQGFLTISPEAEPILLIEAGRHGLVSEDFVRNTSPAWISAQQDALPISLRDADLLVELTDEAPDGVAMILRTDRRLGFDPASEWTLGIEAVREHGMFRPEIGSVTLTVAHATPERYFTRPGQIKQSPPWLDALRNRQGDMIVLSAGLVALLIALGPGMTRLSTATYYTPIRLGILAVVTGFIGWWGQGQLSIVTPLATLRTSMDQGSYAFLLYDPFSLLIWAVTIVGFVLWGRGLFCGWLCPFGALQEFAHHLGRLLRLPRIEPSALWDARLKWVKYVLLGGLVATVFIAPDHVDKAVEVEPFKTAITTFFIREWYYVAYAGLWLVLGTMLFKGFCRYVCPLGALMAIGGLLRGRDWIARRAECGSPCQLCRVKCNYGAIKKTGEIQYSECFQCLDCVTIYNDADQCVPLVLAGRAEKRRPTLSQGVPAE